MNRKREFFEVIRGLGLWLLFGAVALMAVRLRIFFPHSVVAWLGESPDPRTALIAFSAVVSSGLMILLRFGIEVPPLKPLAASETVRVYLTGIPLWVLSVIIAVSAWVLFIVVPVCQPPPGVNFEIQGHDNIYRPSDTIMAKTDDFLVVTAEPFGSDTILSCRWQYIGDAFQTVGSNAGCETSLKLSGKPGTGLLTLQVSQNFCDQSSVFSLNVQVIKP